MSVDMVSQVGLFVLCRDLRNLELRRQTTAQMSAANELVTSSFREGCPNFFLALASISLATIASTHSSTIFSMFCVETDEAEWPSL